MLKDEIKNKIKQKKKSSQPGLNLPNLGHETRITMYKKNQNKL
jgi:hypothetical protein